MSIRVIQLDIGVAWEHKILWYDIDLAIALSSFVPPKDDTSGKFKAVVEVFAALECFEEMSARICLQAREPDAVIKRALFACEQ